MVKKAAWIGRTVTELRMWLGLYFAMGIVQKPSLYSYWEKDQVTVPLVLEILRRTTDL